MVVLRAIVLVMTIAALLAKTPPPLLVDVLPVTVLFVNISMLEKLALALNMPPPSPSPFVDAAALVTTMLSASVVAPLL